MDKKSLSDLLEQARTIAVEAGRKILEVSPEEHNVVRKADGSPVSRADLAAHDTILAGLSRLEPEFPIISEESYEELVNSGGAHRSPGEIYWLVDPLDGTREYIRGRDEYTVNIALVERETPVLGVIYAPALGSLYFAAKGLGGGRLNGGRTPEPLRPNLERHSLTGAVSRSHCSPETIAFLEKHGVFNYIQSGSSLKMCLVAEGRADIYPRFGPTCLWDTAAGYAVAVESGCRVVDLKGRDLVYAPEKGIKHYGFIVYAPAMGDLSL